MADLVDDLEDKSPKDAAEGKPGDAPPAGGKGKPPPGGKGKKPDPKTLILIVLSLAGVVVAWMTFKKPSAAAAAGTATTTGASSATVPTTSGGYVAGATDPNAGAGFASMLNNLSGQLTQLQASIPAVTVPTTPTSPSSGTTAPPSAVPPAPPSFDFANAQSDTYIRNDSNGLISQVGPSGVAVGLTAPQWASVRGLYGPGGAPNVSHYGSAPPPPPKKK